MPSSLILAAVQFEFSTWRLRTNYWWAWAVIGLLVGWLGGMAFDGRRFGCITDILLGLAGAMAGGWLATNYRFMGGDLYTSLAAAAVGAVAFVGLAHLLARDKK